MGQSGPFNEKNNYLSFDKNSNVLHIIIRIFNISRHILPTFFLLILEQTPFQARN